MYLFSKGIIGRKVGLQEGVSWATISKNNCAFNLHMIIFSEHKWGFIPVWRKGKKHKKLWLLLLPCSSWPNRQCFHFICLSLIKTNQAHYTLNDCTLIVLKCDGNSILPLCDMPTLRHFWKRQYWHLLRDFLWMRQWRSQWSYTNFNLIVRLKKPYEERKRETITSDIVTKDIPLLSHYYLLLIPLLFKELVTDLCRTRPVLVGLVVAHKTIKVQVRLQWKILINTENKFICIIAETRQEKVGQKKEKIEWWLIMFRGESLCPEKA